MTRNSLVRMLALSTLSVIPSLAFANNYVVTRYGDGLYSVDVAAAKWTKLTPNIPMRFEYSGNWVVAEYADGLFSFNVTDGKMTKLHQNKPIKFFIAGDYLLAQFSDGLFSIGLATGTLKELSEAVPIEVAGSNGVRHFHEVRSH